MSIQDLIEKSNLNISKENISYNVPMKNYTTFKIGGPAECLVKIYNENDLKEILKFSKKNNINIVVLGNGSNVLVQDGGIKGITLIIKIEKIEIKKENQPESSSVLIKLGAGEKLTKLGIIFMQKGLTGFEELSGIPGTIGGATIMNAGANGREIKDIIKSVKVIDYDGNEKILKKEDIKFEYRKTSLQQEKYIITEIEIELQKENSKEIKEKMDIYRDKRKNSQPLEYPSAGSTFKRGKDFITAKLIDEAGLKGTKVGGAEISTKHAGFIINKGNATAKDVLNLVEKAKEEVYKKFNKKIELEIKIEGEE